jgi:hypothetical protein
LLIFYLGLWPFLIINRARTMATTMIKTNNPAIAGAKYMSAGDCVGASFVASLELLNQLQMMI